MKKLYLHVGLHKTGTSSIQVALGRYKGLLKDNGIFAIPGNSAGLFRREGSDLEREAMFSGYGAVIDKEFVERKIGGIKFDKKNIISSEFLSWLFSAEEIYRLKSVLQLYFDELKIVIYIRRQDKLIVSHFQQASKNNNVFNGFYYSGCSRSIPTSKDNYDEYLDFNERIKTWENAFGRNNIIIRVMESELLFKGDITKDFFNIFGLGNSVDSIRKNESQGFEKTKLGHLINISGVDGLVANLIRQQANNGGRSLPSRSDAIKLYSRYVDSNIDLNSRYLLSQKNEDIFDKNFSSYPDERSDFWVEDTANQAILNILRAMKPLDDIDIDILKESAKALEKTRPELGSKLLSLACTLKT